MEVQPPTPEQLALVQQFEKQGYCVIERALDPTALQAAFHRQIAAARLQFEKDGTGATVSGSGRVLGLPDDWLLRDECFLELAEHPAITPIVAELVGPDFQLQECFSRCYPSEPAGPTVGYVDWHCDHPTPGVWQWLKVHVLLSDVGEDGGAFCLAPGSHRWGKRGDDNSAAAALTQQYGGAQAELLPDLAKMALPAGSIVIFSTHCWHTVLPNTSGIDRNSIFLEYTPFWARQTGSMVRAANNLLAAGLAESAGRRQLLGLLETADEQGQRWVGSGYSKGIYGAYPSQHEATLEMRPWTERLLTDSPQARLGEEADRTLGAAVMARDLASLEEDGYVEISLATSPMRYGLRMLAGQDLLRLDGEVLVERVLEAGSVRDLALQPRLLALVSRALQQPITLCDCSVVERGRTTSVYPLVAVSSDEPLWERDYIPGAERCIAVDIMLAPEESKPEAEPHPQNLEVAVGSHRAEASTHAEAQMAFGEGGVQDHWQQQRDVVDGTRQLGAKVGSAIVYDTRLWRRRRPHHTGDVPSVVLRCAWGSFWRKPSRVVAGGAARVDRVGQLRTPLLRQLAGLELAGTIHWEPPPPQEPASLPNPLAGARL